MRGRARKRVVNRRRFRDEITYYYVGPIRPTGRTVAGWAQKTLGNYGQARPRAECVAMARDAGKRAEFTVERRSADGRPLPPEPERELSPLERCEVYLSVEQRAMLRDVWATIEGQRLRPFRAIAYLDAEKVFAEEAALAARELFRASSLLPGEVVDERHDRKHAASRRLRSIGAALEWLRIRAGGDPDAAVERTGES